MANRTPLAIGEWYHCYNRGTDKRRVFENASDYKRFLAYLYASNGEHPIQISDRRNTDLLKILEDENIDRGHKLVEIGAYALMPNHLHLVIRQTRDGGIARFMQKVFTGYTMYFNLKKLRTGSLFEGTFKSKHISTDDYLKGVLAYVLLNPIELFEPKWKQGKGNLLTIKEKLISYPYSSLSAFLGLNKKHESHKIVSSTSNYYDSAPTLSEMLRDAREYYNEQSPKVKPSDF